MFVSARGRYRQLTRDKRAVDAAASADVAVLVVGYDGNWESEGRDRIDMDLPGDQDALVRAVVAANPRTIVVVNAGAPVSTDWADDTAAILLGLVPWHGGWKRAHRRAVRRREPFGSTAHHVSTPPLGQSVFAHYPGDNCVVHYSEGLLMGYCHYDKRRIEPRFCFGHGLSYTRFEYRDLRLERHGDGLRLSVNITNCWPAVWSGGGPGLYPRRR